MLFLKKIQSESNALESILYTYTSTRSTFTPHGSVASSRIICETQTETKISATLVIHQFQLFQSYFLHSIHKSHQLTCIVLLIDSRSPKISDRFLLPIMFRRVVCAKSRVEAWASLTFVTEIVALYILK